MLRTLVVRPESIGWAHPSPTRIHRGDTWSRNFRFPVAIEREQLQAVYRDGLLTVNAPKANKLSTITVKVEG